MSDFDYVRNYYGVPARKGGRVKFEGRLGTITAGDGPYVRIRFDGEKRSRRFHPTWRIEYLEAQP